MIFAKVAAIAPKIVCTCVDADVGQGTAVFGKDDHITGNEVCISVLRIGVLGNTGTGLIGQGIQCVFPKANCGEVIVVAI